MQLIEYIVPLTYIIEKILYIPLKSFTISSIPLNFTSSIHTFEFSFGSSLTYTNAMIFSFLARINLETNLTIQQLLKVIYKLQYNYTT